MRLFTEIYESLQDFEKRKIPLCAAETFVSDFVKSGLITEFEGKYCMSSLSDIAEYDFIGSSYIHKLLCLLSKECNRIFNAVYTDVRTLTGMNCFHIAAAAVFKRGDRVMLTTPQQGGHPSVPAIFDLLSICYDEIPYNYENYQIDYIKLNAQLKNQNYKAVVFCQSDLLQPPDLMRLDIPSGTFIFYDATQTLGMILTKQLQNPLLNSFPTILIGGTHKTLPSTSCGIIMTNCIDFVSELDATICPSLLRTVQPNNVVSLLFAIEEQERFGKDYQVTTVKIANELAFLLNKNGLCPAKITADHYTDTHQIFLILGKSKSEKLFERAKAHDITLNIKNKTLFNGYGIRLGVQQIARYNWGKRELVLLSELLQVLCKDELTFDDYKRIDSIKDVLILKKTPYYV